MIDSIIFDLDGTLWDATDGASAIWTQEARKYPEVTIDITADMLKAVYGLPLKDIALKLLTTVNEDVALSIMEESVVKQCPYLAKVGGILYDNLESTLIELKKKYRLFIVSNCEDGYIQCFFKAHGLEKYFEDFEYPGRSKKLKADNIKDIISRNNLENPIYVGDTTGDKKASLEANIPFVYARYGFGSVDEYQLAIDSFDELLKLDILNK